jgi:5-methylcytosine-specific restriction protein A
MPIAPLRYCLTQGCPNKVSSGRCPTHTKQHVQAYDQARGTASQRGYDSKWSRYRAGFLEDHWYCGARPVGLLQTGDSACLKQGLWVKANVVDHIVPVRGADDPTFYRMENHQALCSSCHDRKRQRESIQTRTGGDLKCS